MKVTALLENTCAGGLEAAHGLSIYAETDRHKLLFDSGPDGALLIKNAASLGVKLQDIDIAFLSHGHYDHSGGLLSFFESNASAPVYISEKAFEGHFSQEENGWRYIGVDESVQKLYSGRIVPTGTRCEIDSELLLFSDIATSDYLSSACQTLFEVTDNGYCPDRFEHEQNLLISQNGKIVLLSGCSHRGIVNILRRAEDICGRSPDFVFGGFHLKNPDVNNFEPSRLICSIGAELMKRQTVFYTCHCTGEGPYTVLKDLMGEQINYFSGGTTVEI